MEKIERQGYLKAEFDGEKGIRVDINVGPCTLPDMMDLQYCIISNTAENLLEAIGKVVEEDGKEPKRFIADMLAVCTLDALKEFLGEPMEDNKDESEAIS